MKTYSKITNENKDHTYLLNIDGSTLKLIKPFNSISGTYGALSLTVYDDAFSVLKSNLWLLDLDFNDNLEDILQISGFMFIPADNLQTLLYA
jgi:hypothetical protein